MLRGTQRQHDIGVYVGKGREAGGALFRASVCGSLNRGGFVSQRNGVLETAFSCHCCCARKHRAAWQKGRLVTAIAVFRRPPLSICFSSGKHVHWLILCRLSQGEIFSGGSVLSSVAIFRVTLFSCSCRRHARKSSRSFTACTVLSI